MRSLLCACPHGPTRDPHALALVHSQWNRWTTTQAEWKMVWMSDWSRNSDNFEENKIPRIYHTHMNESYFCSRNSIIMHADMQATYNWHRTQYYRPGYKMKAAKSALIQRLLCSIVEKLIWAIIEWSELSLAPATMAFVWCSVFSLRTN